MIKVLFVSGTRADYGKIKPLIDTLAVSGKFEVHVVATGMHMLQEYGLTRIEIERNPNCIVHSFSNQSESNNLAESFSIAVAGINKILADIDPNIVIVHGDRMEAVAGATSALFNHKLIGHIEGGEISGTLDETMRHAITKLANYHFVSNDEARKRVLQMGEVKDNIFVIGSPEADIMLSSDLPSWAEVKKYYEIPFDKFGLVIFHPDSIKSTDVRNHADTLVKAMLSVDANYIIIHPNNDPCAEEIIKSYGLVSDKANFFFIPSMRFEYYLTTLKNAQFMVGNSSSGVREAPIYGVPSLDLGKRQSNRNASKSITHSSFILEQMIEFMQNPTEARFEAVHTFGKGDSASQFLSILSHLDFFQDSTEKRFVEYTNE